MNAEVTPALLDFRNICVMRGQKVALDDFSLRIGADEHVAILGPNGCGKSTLIKTITRECYPVARPESSMSILGQESWDVFALRARLGIVSNDLMLSCTGTPAGGMWCCPASSAASASLRIMWSMPGKRIG